MPLNDQRVYYATDETLLTLLDYLAYLVSVAGLSSASAWHAIIHTLMAQFVHAYASAPHIAPTLLPLYDALLFVA